MKDCSKCGISKSLEEFSRNHRYKDGRQSQCKICVKTYRRTPEGFVAKVYAAQRSNSKKRNHSMPTYSCDELFDWLISQPSMQQLWESWANSNYAKDSIPSVDRLNDYEPYSMDNIQLMTFKENRDKGHVDTLKGINNKRSKTINQYDLDGNHLNNFYSISEAARAIGFPNGRPSIVLCCQGKRTTAFGYKWSYITKENL